MIDASHDNSGKDPARQIVAAGEIADQIAAGNAAIVGVMLESFLVEGRQDLDGDGPLVYGQSITDACMDWDDTVLTLDRLASAVEAARGRRATMRIAVLGVGLIGGSIGLAARQPAGGRGGRLRSRPRAARSRRASSGAIDRARRAPSPRPARGPSSSSAPRRSPALPELAAEALERRGAETVVTDVGSAKRE